MDYNATRNPIKVYSPGDAFFSKRGLKDNVSGVNILTHERNFGGQYTTN